MSDEKPREIALRVLQQRESGEFVETLLETVLRRAPLSPVDRHLCQELVYGVVRWQVTLDWLISRKTRGGTAQAQVPGEGQQVGRRPEASVRLQNLLRLGLYQIFWLDRIPNHAAVNETVELTRKSGLPTRTGFVNAVLRGYLRESEATRKALEGLKRKEPALGYSHPEWLVQLWQGRWGVEKTARLMEWNNTPPKTFARLNTLKTDALALQAQWRNEGVEFLAFKLPGLAEHLVFELSSYPALPSLPSFQKGLFYVQDPSTLLAAEVLAPQPGETVLDLCAAPGGKLTYLAQLMKNQGRLVAHDPAAARLKLVSENCQRLGVTCVETIQKLDSADPTRFDRILIDAPCSNTGVMRRRVDLRWRIRAEEIQRLRLNQLELLRQASGLLKPGGILVYSTCSLEPEENRQLIDHFVGEQTGLKLERDIELLPFVDGVDGAYFAKLASMPVL